MRRCLGIGADVDADADADVDADRCKRWAEDTPEPKPGRIAFQASHHRIASHCIASPPQPPQRLQLQRRNNARNVLPTSAAPTNLD
jgi:hypothetical protein